MNSANSGDISLNQELPISVPYRIMLFALCFIAIALGGTVSTLMSVYLPVAVTDLLGGRNPDELNRIGAYINALFIFGWAIGGLTWGVISDKAGRKKSLLLAIACYGLFTIITGLVQYWWAVVFCRFMSGFGVGGVSVIAFTLLSEVWPQKSRAVVVGILSIAFPAGIFSAGLINYIVSSWRGGFMVGIIPLLMALVGFFFLKESANWKTSRQQNKPGIHPGPNLFSRNYRSNLITGALIFGAMLIGLWAIFSWLPTWVQTLSASHDAQKERGLSMMLLGMGGLIGGFLSGWLANALGLIRSMAVCFTACTILSFILFKTNQSVSPLLYMEIGLLALFFGASQGVLSAMIPLLFPVSIRASATGFCFNIGRLFTGTAVLFVGVMVVALGGYGNALFIFSLVFIPGLITIFSRKIKPLV